MSVLALGKIFLALSTIAGGGTSIYFLTNTDTSKTSQAGRQHHCANPFELKFGNKFSVYAKSRDEAEKLKRDFYPDESEFEIIQKQECMEQTEKNKV